MRTSATNVERASRPARGECGERGFAMLLVFLMASMIAIGLYMEIPRVAMDTQRAKEQLLIDRGEQYKRAIQLFVKDAKRYPGDIKDLESFQNKRYLRHRYVDPMTGKDEWRLIHIQNGVLTDSLVNKQGQQQQKEASTAGQFIGEQVGLGGAQNTTGAGGAANVRDRRRPNEGGAVNGPSNEIPPANASGAPPQYNPINQTNPSGQPAYPVGVPGAQGGIPQGMPGASGTPTGQFPGQTIPGQFPGQTMPGQIPGQTMPGQIPGQTMPGQIPGQTLPGRGGPPTSSVGGGSFVGGGGSFVGGGSLVGSQPNTPGMAGQNPGGMYPGQTLPGQPGQPVNSQFQGQAPQYQTGPGANGVPPNFPQPGMTPGAPNNAAADLIRGILTTPRPGGMPQQGQMGGQTIGGGIAGVASTSEGEGVKLYNDRSLYTEWEFIFDPAKVKQIPNPNAQGAPGTPADRLGNTQGMGQPGQPIQPSPGMPPNPFAPPPMPPGGRR